ASGSTGPINLTKSERWILSEWVVALDRCRRFGETLISHRERTPYAEIDLLFTSKQPTQVECSDRKSVLLSPDLTLVEVKSCRQRDVWGSDVISARQLQRLQRARFSLESRFRVPVRLCLAVVK